MRILHVIPYFAPAWRYGGPVYAALGLTRELVRQGHTVSVMTTNLDGPGFLDVPLDRPVFMGGVEVSYFPVERPRRWWFSRPLGHALQRQVERFDLVHIHSVFLWPSTISALWCRRKSVPYIIRPAGSLDHISLVKPYDRWWVSMSSTVRKWIYLHTIGKRDLNGASALHFTSQAEMDAAGILKLRPPGFVVPLGIDPPMLEEGAASVPLREQFPELLGKKIVLFFSRLDPVKGLDLLIQAMGELAAKRRDFALVLAGSGRPDYEAEVTALVKRHGLQDRTVILGLVQGHAKSRLLREADLFVLPSRHENFGVAVLEAMASGLPVVISNQVNTFSVVNEAGAGLVTDLRSEQIAAAVERLLGDDDLRVEMGRRGAALIREEFTWEKAAGEMVQIYERIVKGMPVAPASSRLSSGN